MRNYLSKFGVLILLFTAFTNKVVSQNISKKNNVEVGIKKILYKKIKDIGNFKLIKEYSIETYFEYFKYPKNKDSIKLIPIKIEKNPYIVLNTYEYINPDDFDYNLFNSEYFLINNKKYSIDSILKKNVKKIIEANPYIEFETAYTFNFKNKKIIAILGQNRIFYRNLEVTTIYAFEFLNNKLRNIKVFYNYEFGLP